MFSGYCATCVLVFVSGQKREPKGCPRCRGTLETVEVGTVDDLPQAWGEAIEALSMPSEEAKGLLAQIPDAIARYERRRAKKGGGRRHRMKKNKEIRQQWKQAHIDLAREKERLSGTPRKKTPFDD